MFETDEITLPQEGEDPAGNEQKQAEDALRGEFFAGPGDDKKPADTKPSPSKKQFEDLQNLLGAPTPKRDVAPPKDAPKDAPKETKLAPKDPKAAPLASVYGLATALDKFEQFVKGKFTATNGNQKEALDYQEKLKGELGKIPKTMLDSMASTNVNELNKFLKDKGYEVQLKPLGKDGVGVVTSFELEGKWAGTNYKGFQGSDGKPYEAFKLKTGQFYKVDGHDAPVVKIYEDKESGVSVYVTPYEAAAPGLDAAAIAAKLTPKGAPTNPGKYDAVVMPKVDMSRSVELSWLLGLKNSSGHTIDQALAQTMLQMDQNGFKAKEGLAIGGSRGIEPPNTEFKMDKPFLFFAVKDGMSAPLFATTVDQQYWKDPKKAK